jgi:hypothetical protein
MYSITTADNSVKSGYCRANASPLSALQCQVVDVVEDVVVAVGGGSGSGGGGDGRNEVGAGGNGGGDIAND